MSEGLLDDVTLAQVEDVLQSACGLTLARSLRRSLETALARAAQVRGLSAPVFLRQLLLREPAAVEVFIEHAVIGETYFFRHPEHLRALARLAVGTTGTFHVWSAGCASGEEPYSIAMALRSAGMTEGRFRVLATDVSGRALERARAGVYGPWSLRRIEPDLERQFLAEDAGDLLSVVPEVRRAVDFRRHNLAMDPVPTSGLNAIFCRNVLIYFPPELVARVLQRLVAALAPGGLLFVSPAEVPLTNALGMETLDAEGCVVLRLPPPGWKPAATAASAPRKERTRAVPYLRLLERPRALEFLDVPPPPVEVEDAPIEAPGSEAMSRARDAARAGRFDEAEALAREAARALSPEAYLLLAMVAESRGDLDGAVAEVRKALYLEPQLALGHATLVSLYGRLERREDAEHARQNALRALDGLDDEQPLRGVETMTAGGLRQALSPRTQAGWRGAR
ncbi:protein-glutamate O-methyltransferase CheR [Corallococcus sp. M34]|uniref:CheR family methyltransferase n=1 Tax=Citreicoccus inhibens TaxID=2849499 RepID=UPI001C212175|nr:protein-glutamate O-methyltransferase CheR [Citreicoccus inhibens]MBU8898219.1 protein-glutamate O-methyltransferase CheR [Citreicoccus inhibens]